MSVDCTDGEPLTVENRRYRKARQEHVCCACKEKIRSGDVYRNWFIVFDGDAETYKHCLRCARMYDEIAKRMDCDQAPDFKLNCGHSWQEVHCDEPPPEVARLAFMSPDDQQRELLPARRPP